MLDDLRLVLRSLGRSGGFTLLAVGTLGLGVGAATAVVAVADALLARPLPFPDSERLVALSMVDTRRGEASMSVAWIDHLDWRAMDDLFAGVAASTGATVDLVGEGEPERLSARLVTADFFPLLAPEPLLGRGLTDDDFATDAPAVAVLGEGLWRRRFGARTDVVGTSLQLGTLARTVVGVVSEEGVWPAGEELWLPLVYREPRPDWLARRDNYYLDAMARLRPGVTATTAQAALDVWADRIARELPDRRGGVRVAVAPLRDRIVGPRARTTLALLGIAVTLVLLLAGANVGGLALGRAASRRREQAVRAALGAGRLALLRRPLVEDALVAAGGGLAGLALAVAGIAGLRTLAPAGVRVPSALGLDPRTVGIAAAATAFAALASVVLPALHALRRPAPDLVRAGRGEITGGRLRRLLVAAQIAASLALLVGCGLLVESLVRLARSDAGVETAGRLSLEVSLPWSRYPEPAAAEAFYDGLRADLAVLPGVRAVAAASRLPLGGEGIDLTRAHLAEGAPEPPAGSELSALWNVVAPGTFRAWGVELLQGRDVDDGDRADAPLVAVVDRAFADALFPGEDAIGRRFRSWRDEDLLREIVGVVEPVRYGPPGQAPMPMVYVPYRQVEWPRLGTLTLVTDGDPRPLAADARAAVWRRDASLPVTAVATFDDLVARGVAGERATATLVAAFAALALPLAALGLYGVVAFAVVRGRREIGVRVALGARPREIRRWVLGQGARLWLAGSVLGLAAAVAFSRVLASLLYEVSAASPLVFLAATAILAAVTWLACAVPATRASRVDPVVALRDE